MPKAVGAATTKPAATSAKPSLIRELVDIADYITHVRNEIAALRANELTRDRLPMAHEELDSVVQATAGATNSIMTAAEEILSLPDDGNYRASVEARMNDIFEACTFQDITGQRIRKVVDALRQLETRLSRFATAVKARDEAGIDPAEMERRMRDELLILNGPQLKGPATPQDAIDALFD
ncbi:chemotaxis protein [Methylobacterium sp. Leaf399]|uniref:protein phosphatase CheZ n=1 Tax=unclassified Methylobacterium TaxID=2615210 RepID=UPI0006FF9614|nr:MULTISPECIES: protein phosphatase CheZ [unclassified Methylobacterium]KQP58221.1 chemotaxis protein [Methylobacterium sp. Leaf108]KQT10109.1 chemotaxis protein [Methylobacterium sp. Leaf399]KQT87241.1 chemotaxis protein [Methylobacterium sp. Leaf466]